MCESAAARNLEALSKTTVYSNDTRDSVRFNAATLFRAQSLRDGSFKVPIPGTLEAFSKVVNQLANSPEFIQAMPKEKMDPKMCRSLLTDPKTMKQIATSFNENMKKNANKSQIKELVNEKKLQEAVEKKEEPAKNQPHV
jgi:biotin synthase-related radical SAM superfamily protein